jgi:hypothetical protein
MNHDRNAPAHRHRRGEQAKLRDQRHASGEPISPNGDLSQLEGDIAAVAHDFRAGQDYSGLQRNLA